MAFDGERFVQDLREELEASGRGLDKSIWVEKVVQGEATPQDLVGWARQHYWGVTYHTRRVLSAWVTRIPYDMRRRWYRPDTEAVFTMWPTSLARIGGKNARSP